jgi:hypothetical protein
MSKSNPELTDALDYARRVFDKVLDWYKNADSKAQIILTLDGIFLTFLTSSVFRSPNEISNVISRFKFDTWLFLALMCLCLVGSIVSALMCLWSRVFLRAQQDSVLIRAKEELKTSERYSPNVMLFFKTISWLDHDEFQEQLGKVDKEFEIKALASQIFLLSKRVYRKHLLINCGFVLAGASLIFFLAVGISYLARFK